MNDYSCYNAIFVAGLQAFLDYTTPHALDNTVTNGMVARRRLQKGDFEKRCIQRWAISELMDSIVNNPQEPVEDTTYKLALEFLLRQWQLMRARERCFTLRRISSIRRLSASSERRRGYTHEEVFLAAFSIAKKTQTKTQGRIGGV